ncbi:hypothetical protein DFJ73DRAFT_92972 [Zopfochytrium polystomum]|nr:hypothetical protein DFJ73DRAFT_92972 [Zopfochytrium polystomum]
MNFLSRVFSQNGSSGPNTANDASRGAVTHTPISRIGAPSRHPRATAIAYDRAQSLVAVGFADGSVLVVGSPPNFEKLLRPPTRGAPVRHLKFKTGEKYLVSINSNDEVVVWDLTNCQLLHLPFPLGRPVSRLETPLAAGWLYIGLETGEVVIFDIRRAALSDYTIPLPSFLNPSPPPRVAVLECCPVDPNLILIGYETGALIVWDLAEQTVFRKYVFAFGTKEKSAFSRAFTTKGKAQPAQAASDTNSVYSSSDSSTISSDGQGLRLGAASWRPDGLFIASAHGKYVAVWSVQDTGLLSNLKALTMSEKERKPVAIRTLDGFVDSDDGADAEPISDMQWVSRPAGQDGTALFVAGGTVSGIPKFITAFEHIAGKDFKSGFKQQLQLVERGLSFERLISFSPLPSHPAQDLVVLALTTSGIVSAHSLSAFTAFNPLSLSPSLVLLKSADVLAATLISANFNFLIELRQSSAESQLQLVKSSLEECKPSAATPGSFFAPPIPISGGNFASSIIALAASAAGGPVSSNDVFITLHSDSSLQFWQSPETGASLPSPPVLLSSLSLGSLISLEKTANTAPSSSSVSLYAGYRTLVISCGAMVIVLRFISARDVESATSVPAPSAPAVTRESLPVDPAGSNSVLNAERADDKPVASASSPGVTSETQSQPDAPPARLTPAPPLPERGPPLPPRKDLIPSPAMAESEVQPAPPAVTGEDEDMGDEEMEKLMADLDATVDSVLAESKATSDALKEGIPGQLSPNVSGPTVSSSSDLAPAPSPPRRVSIGRHPGWVIMAQAIHHDVVVCSQFCGWLNVLAMSTADGSFTVLDVVSGRNIHTEKFIAHSDGSPNEVSVIHFADTFVDNGSGLRPIMLIGTARGGWFGYEFNQSPGADSRFTLRKFPLRRSPSSHQSSVVNKPLSITVLNDSGLVVTQQAPSASGEGTENYVVLAGSHRAEVVLLQPQKPATIVAERALSAGGPGALAVAAGFAIARGVPSLVVVSRDGGVTAFGLPGLEASSGGALGPGAAGSEVGVGGSGVGWGLGPRRVRVLDDGRVFCWSADREMKVMPGFCDPARFPTVQPSVYDASKQIAFAKVYGRQGASSTLAFKDPALDSLFAIRRIVDESEQLDLSLSQGGDKSTAEELSEAKNKLNERGEALSNLERRMNDLNHASASFAETVRKYNEEQAKKKWWQP